MNHSYNELIPDEVIDTFYDKIKKCIEEKRNYNHYIKNILLLNDNRVPLKITNLINKND